MSEAAYGVGAPLEGAWVDEMGNMLAKAFCGRERGII